MDFNANIVAKLAGMSKLSLSPERCEELATELGNILEYIELLQEVDVSDKEPTAQVTGLHQVTVEDNRELAALPNLQEEILKCSPQTVDMKQIKVPKVL